MTDYYYFADTTDLSRNAPCALPRDCTLGRDVFSSVPMMEHELLHSYLAGVGLPPPPILEGMAESLGCLRSNGSATPERSWPRTVEEFPTADLGIYASDQRVAKRLLSDMGIARTIAYYRQATFTMDPAFFALQFERTWGRPFSGFWADAIEADPLPASLPECPCRADSIAVGSLQSALAHVNAPDYRPLDAASESFVLEFTSTGGVLVQDCARLGPLVRVLAVAAQGASTAIVRTGGVPHFLSFPSNGTEALSAVSSGPRLESDCASASSFAAGGGQLGVAGPRAGRARWYLRLATPVPLMMTRQDGGTSGLRLCRDCSLGSCQDLVSTGDAAPVSDGMVLELTPDAPSLDAGLGAATVSFL